MARIRSVHPGLSTDEDLLECSVAARLFFIMLGTEADDAGCFDWKPVRLKMRVFPADNIEVEPLLAELVAVNRIVHYTVDGKHYGAIRNFTLFQRPKKPVHRCPRDGAKIFPSGEHADINNYIGLTKKGTELDPVKDGGGGEPETVKGPPSTEPKAPDTHKKRELGQHREEGGDNREEIKEDSLSGSIGDSTPRDAASDASPDGPPATPPAAPSRTWDAIGFRVLTIAGLEDRPWPVPVTPVKDWLARGWTEDQIMAGVRTVVARTGYQPPKNLKYFEGAIAEAAAAPAEARLAYARTFTADFDERRWLEYLAEWSRGLPWPAAVIGPEPNQPGTLVWPELLARYKAKFGNLDPLPGAQQEVACREVRAAQGETAA